MITHDERYDFFTADSKAEADDVAFICPPVVEIDLNLAQVDALKKGKFVVIPMLTHDGISIIIKGKVKKRVPKIKEV